MNPTALEPGRALNRAQLLAGVAGIDWDAWTPTVRATLGFVIREDRILLIDKKRGLGAGKITGPGGKLEAGESARACAVRELREELGITMQDPQRVGEFSAQFVDGLAMRVDVFVSSDFDGLPRESDEAVPRWVSLDAIPFEQMWPDNRLWLPHLIARREFNAVFVLDYEQLYDSRVRLLP